MATPRKIKANDRRFLDYLSLFLKPRTIARVSSSKTVTYHHQNNGGILASQGLRFAPPEIRQMIFCQAFENEKPLLFPLLYTELPALLKVLRDSDPVLYQEALSAWSKVARFSIRYSDEITGNLYQVKGKRLGDAGAAACRLVRKLHVDSSYLLLPLSIPTDAMLNLLSFGKNVEELSMRIHAVPSQDLARYLQCKNSFLRCIKSFPKLKRFTLTAFNFSSSYRQTHHWSYSYDKSTWAADGFEAYLPIFTYIDRVFGPGTDGSGCTKDKFFLSIRDVELQCRREWTAKGGKFLVWEDVPEVKAKV